MTRNFDDSPIPRSKLREMLALARNAPSAGFAQGVEFLLLDRPEQTASFWDVTLPPAERGKFPWPGLLSAPVLVLPLCDPRRYLRRYSEADKASSAASAALGKDLRAWPVRYWLVDGAFAVQNLLLAATERGLGSLFFGIFKEEAALRERLGIPAAVELLGAVALGRQAEDVPNRPSASAARGWRPLDEILHWETWGVHAC